MKGFGVGYEISAAVMSLLITLETKFQVPNRFQYPRSRLSRLMFFVYPVSFVIVCSLNSLRAPVPLSFRVFHKVHREDADLSKGLFATSHLHLQLPDKTFRGHGRLSGSSKSARASYLCYGQDSVAFQTVYPCAVMIVLQPLLRFKFMFSLEAWLQQTTLAESNGSSHGWPLLAAISRCNFLRCPSFIESVAISASVIPAS